MNSKNSELGKKREELKEMTAVRALSSKGQVVVPKEIREHLGASDGDRVQFSINHKGEVILSIIKEPDLMELFGSLPPREKTDKDFTQILKEAKEERVERLKKEGKL